jgi:hypothetical protein
MKRSSIMTTLPCKRSKLDTLTDVVSGEMKRDPEPPLQHKRVMELKKEARYQLTPIDNPALKKCFDLTDELKREAINSTMNIAKFSTTHLCNAVKQKARAVSAHVFTMKNDSNAKTFIQLGNVSAARYSLNQQHQQHVLAIEGLTDVKELDANLMKQLECLKNETLLLKSISDHANVELVTRNNMYRLLYKELKSLRTIHVTVK